MAGRGAPIGNDRAKRGKEWRDAIRKALVQYEVKDDNGKVIVKRGEGLHAVATRLVDAAMTGDTSALKELGDRLDGKPHQSIDLEATGKNGAPLIPAINLAVDAMKAKE